jgi:hypothetical protein
MNDTVEKIMDLLHRVPRRHTAENVKEIYGILDEYEDLLQTVEADPRFEQEIARFFEGLDPIRSTVKKSNDPKLSKKAKDVLFDEASGLLKDALEDLKQVTDQD